MCQVGSPNQKPSEVFIILEDQASLRFKELNRALYPSLFNFPKSLNFRSLGNCHVSQLSAIYRCSMASSEKQREKADGDIDKETS